MNSDEQKQALGELLVAFAGLDYIVTLAAASLLNCRDLDVAWDSVKLLEFGRKCDRLKELVKYYAPKYDLESEGFLNVIGQVGLAGQERNAIVHSHITIDLETRQLKFKRVRDEKLVNADVESLRKLSKRTEDLKMECYRHADGFRYLIERKLDAQEKRVAPKISNL